MPDEVVWDVRNEGRRELFVFLRKSLVRQHGGRGTAADRIREHCEQLDPDTLTLGFAQRYCRIQASRPASAGDGAAAASSV